MVRENLVGRRFGRLVVDEFAGKNRHGHLRWHTSCDCGKKAVVIGNLLRRGDTQSCGCLHAERQRSDAMTHGSAYPGATHWREYRIWTGIIARCENPKRAGFADYGARGIGICRRWREDFSAFLLDMGPRPSPMHSIDRIDNNKGYEAANCRWALPRQQAQNRRSNVYLTFADETLCIEEWARRCNVDGRIIRARMMSGLPLEKVLAEGPKYNRR